MKNIEKQELYNSIMNEVAKTVKTEIEKHSYYEELLLDFIDNFDFDKIPDEEWKHQYYNFKQYTGSLFSYVDENCEFYTISEDIKRYKVSDIVYPANQVEDDIVKKFKLHPWQVKVKRYNNILTFHCENLLYLILPNIDENLKIIDNEMKSLGYFRGCIVKSHRTDENQEWVTVVYNPIKKYNCDDYVRGRVIVLYHLTSVCNLENIKKYGLIPHSSELFNNEERLFFICNNWINKDYLYMMKRIIETQYNNPECVVIPIIVSKLPKDIIFYSDPNADECVYTNSIIKPEYINFNSILDIDIFEEVKKIDN